MLDHLTRLVDYAGTSIWELDGAELAFLGCVSTILRKLQLASRTQAALYAIREGIAPLERTDTSD